MRTINKLLDIFQARGLLTESGRVADSDELEKPADDRARVVRELLDTERKYVQDLEVMQVSSTFETRRQTSTGQGSSWEELLRRRHNSNV